MENLEIMDKSTEGSKHLRKLIDIPESILGDLKKMAGESGTNLKNYIQNVLLETVNKYRNNASPQQ